MSGSVDKKLCGLYGCHVVQSDYNENGNCKCLSCSGLWCQDCTKYKNLLDEANKNDWIKMERCINCQKQK